MLELHLNADFAFLEQDQAPCEAFLVKVDIIGRHKLYFEHIGQL